MTLTVLFFAAARDLAGTGRVTLQVPERTTLRDLCQTLELLYPRLVPFLPRCSLARNGELAAGENVLENGDEIAVLPPVSGG
jgi:molybdopterin converting factor subunit 1